MYRIKEPHCESLHINLLFRFNNICGDDFTIIRDMIISVSHREGTVHILGIELLLQFIRDCIFILKLFIEKAALQCQREFLYAGD